MADNNRLWKANFGEILTPWCKAYMCSARSANKCQLQLHFRSENVSREYTILSRHFAFTSKTEMTYINKWMYTPKYLNYFHKICAISSFLNRHICTRPMHDISVRFWSISVKNRCTMFLSTVQDFFYCIRSNRLSHASMDCISRWRVASNRPPPIVTSHDCVWAWPMFSIFGGKSVHP